MIEFLICFIISVVSAPLIIFYLKKRKFGQNILGYVVEHQSKQGTPTMGGIIFILPTVLVGILFNLQTLHFVLFVLSVFLGFSLIGFLDDYIKIKFHRNLGLKPYQKILFQLLLSIIVAIYVYKSEVISSEVIIPFANTKLNLGVLIIPFIVLTFLACTNSVNLTDGLDGLAGGVSLFCVVFFALIINVFSLKLGYYNTFLAEANCLKSLCFCLGGALFGYLIFNVYPASIFMGDTGSLGLGGIISIVACLCQLELFLLIVGIMFVVSSISVIVQVVYFKFRKKRIFLMAPFHHHLQHKGIHESKIVFIYICITVLAGIICIMFI